MAGNIVLYLQCGVVLVASLLAAQLFVQLVVYPFFHPLAKFPGPYWASTSRIWMAYKFWNGTEMDTLQSLHAKHGRQHLCGKIFGTDGNMKALSSAQVQRYWLSVTLRNFLRCITAQPISQNGTSRLFSERPRTSL
jgi:hypothetical protein